MGVQSVPPPEGAQLAERRHPFRRRAADALRELVSAIYVDAPDKSSGKRVQHIHIKYDGLGYIPLDELEAKEKA